MILAPPDPPCAPMPGRTVAADARDVAGPADGGQVGPPAAAGVRHAGDAPGARALLAAKVAAMRVWMLVLVPVLLGVQPAFADCEGGIAALAPRIATVTDAHLRTMLQVDLKRAQFELWEFDEVECAMALEHAARLLKLGL